MAATKLHYGYAVEEMVSYLPLSHVAAQITDIFIPLVFAGSIYFAEPDAMKVHVIGWLFQSDTLLFILVDMSILSV